MIAGEVRGFEPTAPIASPVYPRGQGGDPVTAALTPKDVRKLGRFSHLGLGAGLEAYVDSGLDSMRGNIASERFGVNLGVGLGGLPEIVAMHEVWRVGGFRKISPFFILQSAPNILAGQMAILLNCRGPNMSIASACATSGHSIGESARAIQRGDADFMLAGGAEAVITPVAVGAFAQMKALSTRNDAPEKASRPYDADRDGFVIGEGAVVFVLEEMGHARARGARIYAELLGYGATADAHHLSSLAPEAEGSRRSMQLALAEGGVETSRVGYVSAHATSTPGGDGEEAAAIAAVFSGQPGPAPRERREVDDGSPPGGRRRAGRTRGGPGDREGRHPAHHQPRQPGSRMRRARPQLHGQQGSGEEGRRGAREQLRIRRDQRLAGLRPRLSAGYIPSGGGVTAAGVPDGVG